MAALAAVHVQLIVEGIPTLGNGALDIKACAVDLSQDLIVITSRLVDRTLVHDLFLAVGPSHSNVLCDTGYRTVTAVFLEWMVCHAVMSQHPH